jgi:hypothetical protein
MEWRVLRVPSFHTVSALAQILVDYRLIFWIVKDQVPRV